MQFSFKGRKVVIAGGSRGIGRSIALAFAEQGADVAICARSAPGLEATAAELRAFGGKVFSMACDLGEPDAAGRLVSGAADALGGLDVLVNNASGFGSKDDEAGWAASMNVDLMATVRATQTAIPYLEKAQAGAVVNISSISGLLAVPRSLPYAAIKAAVVNYTMGQGRALAAKGIRVNCIAPGSIEFPGGSWEKRRTTDPDLYNRTLASVPSGRLGKPEEIAKVALFLASDMASWVTGQTIVVDGGQMLT